MKTRKKQIFDFMLIGFLKSLFLNVKRYSGSNSFDVKQYLLSDLNGIKDFADAVMLMNDYDKDEITSLAKKHLSFSLVSVLDVSKIISDYFLNKEYHHNWNKLISDFVVDMCDLFDYWYISGIISEKKNYKFTDMWNFVNFSDMIWGKVDYRQLLKVIDVFELQTLQARLNGVQNKKKLKAYGKFFSDVNKGAGRNNYFIYFGDILFDDFDEMKAKYADLDDEFLRSFYKEFSSIRSDLLDKLENGKSTTWFYKRMEIEYAKLSNENVSTIENFLEMESQQLKKMLIWSLKDDFTKTILLGKLWYQYDLKSQNTGYDGFISGLKKQEQIEFEKAIKDYFKNNNIKLDNDGLHFDIDGLTFKTDVIIRERYRYIDVVLDIGNIDVEKLVQSERKIKIFLNKFEKWFMKYLENTSYSNVDFYLRKDIYLNINIMTEEFDIKVHLKQEDAQFLLEREKIKLNKKYV